MTKKILLFIVSLCLVLCFVLSSCSCGGDNTPKTDETTKDTNVEENEEPKELTAEEQKAKIAETLSNLKVADLAQISIDSKIKDELAPVVDELSGLINTVLSYGKKYSFTTSYENLIEGEIQETKTLEGNIALGDGQIAVNLVEYSENSVAYETNSDDGEEELSVNDAKEHKKSFNIVNKDGDTYIIPDGMVEKAIYFANINEILATVKDYLSKETKFGFEDTLNMVPADVLE